MTLQEAILNRADDWLSLLGASEPAPLRAGVARAMARLREVGARPGDHVALVADNSLDWFHYFLAVVLERQVAVLLHPQLHPRELAGLLAHSESVAVVATADLLDQIGSTVPGIDITRPGEASDALEVVGAAANDPACLLYTSGTSGSPRGVVLTHGNVAAAASAIARTQGFDASTRMLAVVPFCSVLGLVVTALTPLLSGGRTLCWPSFGPLEVGGLWTRAQAAQATHVCLVPGLVRLLTRLSEPAAGPVPVLYCSTAPLFPAEQTAFEQRFGTPIHQAYGLTESTAWATCASPSCPAPVGSVGRPCDCEVRLDDDGEILLRGPRIMQGYFGNPALTRETLRDGWLRSGDLGRIDDAGNLFVIGRRKLMIARGAFKVHPSEVDEALLSHPDVLEAATAGVPDSAGGEAIHSWVVTRPQGCDAASLRTHLRERISSHKIPDRIHFVTALPKGPTGKIRPGSLGEP